MIVCIDNPHLIPAIHAKANSLDTAVFNFSSAYSCYIPVTDLITHMSMIQSNDMPVNQFIDDITFDIQYANLVLGYPVMFHRFMMIMAQEYIGSTVILMIQRDPYRDAVLESLLKLIQQRYGINGWIVNDIEDVWDIHPTKFSPIGLLTMDADIQRHEGLYRSGAVPERLFPDVCVETR